MDIQAKNYRVLLVDDEQNVLNALRRELTTPPLGRHHYDVETFTSATEALERAKEQPFDLVISDYLMPAMDGLKLLRFAVSSGMDKNRIVILSGRDADFLHNVCPMGTCLAVLNKFEARQKSVLDMVFNSLNQKAGAA